MNGDAAIYEFLDRSVVQNSLGEHLSGTPTAGC